MNRNQKGYSAVGVLLLLGVVVIVGVVGWFVWSNKSKSNVDITPASITNNTSDKSAPDAKTKELSPSWQRLYSKNKKFSLQIPDGWTVYNSPSGDSIYVSDNMSEPNKDNLNINEGTDVIVINDDLRRGMIAPFNASLFETKLTEFNCL